MSVPKVAFLPSICFYLPETTVLSEHHDRPENHSLNASHISKVVLGEVRQHLRALDFPPDLEALSVHKSWIPHREAPLSSGNFQSSYRRGERCRGNSMK